MKPGFLHSGATLKEIKGWQGWLKNPCWQATCPWGGEEHRRHEFLMRTLFSYLTRARGCPGRKEGSAPGPRSVLETSRNEGAGGHGGGAGSPSPLSPAGTHSSSVMASWQLSQTLTSNSKPIRGMEERLELHLPQTAFPHLRQWCWRGREHRLARAPATRPRHVGAAVANSIRLRMLNKSAQETDEHTSCVLFLGSLFKWRTAGNTSVCVTTPTLYPHLPTTAPPPPILGPSQLRLA